MHRFVEKAAQIMHLIRHLLGDALLLEELINAIGKVFFRIFQPLLGGKLQDAAAGNYGITWLRVYTGQFVKGGIYGWREYFGIRPLKRASRVGFDHFI